MGWNTWHQGAGSGSHFWGHCSWSSHCINAPGDRHSCRRNAEQVTGPEHDQYSRRGDPIPGLVSTYIQDQDTLFPGGGNVYQTTCQPGHPEINHLGWTGLYMKGSARCKGRQGPRKHWYPKPGAASGLWSTQTTITASYELLSQPWNPPQQLEDLYHSCPEEN